MTSIELTTPLVIADIPEEYRKQFCIDLRHFTGHKPKGTYHKVPIKFMRYIFDLLDSFSPDYYQLMKNHRELVVDVIMLYHDEITPYCNIYKKLSKDPYFKSVLILIG